MEVCVELKCHNTDSCRKVQNFNIKKKNNPVVPSVIFSSTAASTFLLKICNEMLGQAVNYADTKTNSEIIFAEIPLNKVTHLILTAPLLPTTICFYIETGMAPLNTHKRVPHHCSELVVLWKKRNPVEIWKTVWSVCFYFLAQKTGQWSDETSPDDQVRGRSKSSSLKSAIIQMAPLAIKPEHFSPLIIDSIGY